MEDKRTESPSKNKRKKLIINLIITLIMCLYSIHSEKINIFCFTTYLKLKIVHKMKITKKMTRDKDIYFCFYRMSSLELRNYIVKTCDLPFFAFIISNYFDYYKKTIYEISNMTDDYKEIKEMATIGIKWHEEGNNKNFYKYYHCCLVKNQHINSPNNSN